MASDFEPTRLTMVQVDRLLAQFETDRLVVSTAFRDAGVEPLFARLQRAAINQVDDGLATGSRYAIWANTVRDNILAGMRAFEEGDAVKGRYHLVRAANSLSAYSELQAHLDPLQVGRPEPI